MGIQFWIIGHQRFPTIAPQQRQHEAIAHFHTNPTVRLAQYRALDTTFSMAIAQKLILGKIRNQRYLLQRRNRETQGKITQLTEAIDTIASYFPRLKQTETPLDRNELMGVEGVCARIYFQALTHWFPPEWKFTGRNRRPPKDPVNALLSWGYGVLLARVFAATVQAGLDPYLGFFHANAPFRPNLVLDLMEEFRPVVVDRVAIALINSGLIDPNDFEPAPGEEEGIWLGQTVKKLYLGQLERQLQDSILYPPQHRKLKLSQILLEQGRSLGHCLVETRLDYEAFIFR